ncbi:heterokaryon incompatibility protein-domain-containing protein [Diaporthe sp. PMI_573]|nr:heterokaryon incompatibility protein-domain-containing protein [Diaporthaceae sp. PMI_573]
MSATAYPYTPLKPATSIRLFSIKSELVEGRVSCTLKQFDGKEFDSMVFDGKECDGKKCNGKECYGRICHGKVPPYSALSYVWGDPKPTRQIYLGDYLIDVHETLWEFLDETQTSQEAETWFWTDFLCLDQSDKTEMGEQVQRMGDIYSGAEETLAWLGREGSPSVFL